MAGLAVGCAVGDPGTKVETTVTEGDRSKAQTAQEPVGLDAQVVSRRGQGNLPAGFGEGSLWVIGSIRATPPSASASASALPEAASTPPTPPASTSAPGAAGAGAGPDGPPKALFVGLDPQTDEEVATSGGGPVAPKAVLRRLDPQTGEVVATIPPEDLNNTFTQVAFGAGPVWVSSGY